MKNRFVENKEFLLALSKCKPKLRKSIVSNCSKESIFSIIECVLNVCNGNVEINKEVYEKLKPFNPTFKKLLNKKVSVDKKRHLIIQKGGFLGVLIPAIVTGLASIISAAISKN